MYMLRRLFLIAKVGMGTLCTIVGVVLASPLPAKDPPSMAEIVDGIQHAERLLFENQSLLLRCERTKVDELIRAQSAGLVLAEWTLAYKGNMWLSERRFTEPRHTAKLWIPEKPITQIYRDGVLLRWHQSNESADVDPSDYGRNIYQGTIYTRNLSMNAPKYIAASLGVPLDQVRKQPACRDYVDLPLLPDYLRNNQEHYNVATIPEDVDGAQCWRVEWPDVDCFWVDPERGFAVVRRAYHWGKGQPLMYEFRNLDYREVKPGLWLPFRQIEEKYGNIAEPPAVWGKIVARSEYRLQAVEIDNVPDKLFYPKLPPGTRVNDGVRKMQYRVSETESDPFGAAVIEAKKHLTLSRFRFWPWLVAITSGLAVIAITVAWRRWHSRGTGQAIAHG